MPFITEEIWQAVYDGNPPAKSIALSRYPISTTHLNTTFHFNKPAVLEMWVIQKVVVALRSFRKDVGVPEKEIVDAKIYCRIEDGMLTAGYIPTNGHLFEHLARVRLRLIIPDATEPHTPVTETHTRSEAGFQLAMDYDKPVDVPAERERLTKDIAKFEKGLAAAERQLGNESFLAKAPANIVEGLKKQESETRQLLEKAKAALAVLPPE
jgi:valyl-tRNA synthetase